HVDYQQITHNLHTHGTTTYLELGPDNTLTTLTHHNLPHHTPNTHPLLHPDHNDTTQLLTTLAHAHTAQAVDWTTHYTRHAPRPQRIDLPTYPFQRQRFWLTSTPDNEAAQKPSVGALGEIEARFWETVEEQDAQALATTLDVQADASLDTLLPALSAWHQQQRDQNTINTWTYRETWKPHTPTTGAAANGVLTGTWLIPLPANHTDHPLITAVLNTLHQHGAHTLPLPLDHTHTTPQTLTPHLNHTLTSTKTDIPDVSGVLSLLALDETPHPDHPAVPTGTALTLALIQTLTTHPHLTAPLWCAT
ncbi:hypothetical protein, partial [Streptomyces stramineus]|uniref:hypothetical protein n=1 Tax=Streptomyces stramineus TaxID=173861 RepID=UPI0031D389F2